MPTIEQYKRLLGLSDEDVQALIDAGVLKPDDLEESANDASSNIIVLNNDEEEETSNAEDTSIVLPTTYELPDVQERAKGIHCDNVSDALIMCLSTCGRVDIEFISAITGIEDYKEIIEALKGSIYQNPEKWGECYYKGWETSDEYLSGNLMRKWNIASEANEKYEGIFQSNLDAITRVMPPTVTSEDIYITLGSPWVPTDVIDAFIIHLFGVSLVYCDKTGQKFNDKSKELRTTHDEITGTWSVMSKKKLKHNVAANKIYGTSRIDAIELLEDTLNMKDIVIYDEIPAGINKIKRVVNKDETLAAREKQKRLISSFKDWVWEHPDRKKRLEGIFEDKYSAYRRRIFDGSFLTFPDMNKDIKLRPYQQDAIARIIFTPNTLLAHDVGSGKTFIMIAAGHELKRMGLSTKNMYVVPNGIINQWRDIYHYMYPDARILCVDRSNFSKKKRVITLERMRDEDYDAILITSSCFKLIQVSKKYYVRSLKAEISSLESAIKKNSNASLTRKKMKKEKELEDIQFNSVSSGYTVYFDELGVTRLFVDEAHEYKNVDVGAKMYFVRGISTSKSAKSNEMMDKVRIVQNANGGSGIVFATGTPVTNSLTDAFVMQKYLQNGQISILGWGSFEEWIGMFAERVDNFEVTVDNSYKIATRFSKFHNLPELTSVLSEIADFHQVDEEEAGLPAFNGYTDILIPRSKELSMYIDQISERADKIHSGKISNKEDNMLALTGDGRRAALEIRLVMPEAPYTYDCKIARCVENVSKIYRENMDKKSTQIVFCDISVPKPDEFNVYDELKFRLIEAGIPANEIELIHGGCPEEKRSEIFRAVNKGDIRVVVGSTNLLGVGVNVQEKLIAVHHLDIPWRPADMMQREGRIIRQGNTNEEVFIYRYITEGSFDAYSWQLLEMKQNFIVGLLSGSIDSRNGSDIEDTVLDYAEVKALAIGNPLVKDRVEVANELRRLTIVQKQVIESRLQMEKVLMELPTKIYNYAVRIANCESDIKAYRKWCKDNQGRTKKDEEEERRIIREQIISGIKSHYFSSTETELLSYRGFTIVLPKNMIPEKPYLRVVNNGSYIVELSESDVGNLVRIDNVLDNLKDFLKKLKEQHMDLVNQEAAIRSELDSGENYSATIEELKIRLQEIDDELGVV